MGKHKSIKLKALHKLNKIPIFSLVGKKILSHITGILKFHASPNNEPSTAICSLNQRSNILVVKASLRHANLQLLSVEQNTLTGVFKKR